MSETPPAVPPAPQPAAPAPPAKKGLPRWASVIIGIVAFAVGGVKLLDTFTLPSCESSRSLDTIKSIFKDKKVPEPTLTGAKGLTSTSAEKTCQTNYELKQDNGNTEKGTLDYKVFWEGWSVKVMITKVDTI